MTAEVLEQRIAQLRVQLLICRTPKGKEKVMTVEECRRTGSSYIHIVSDDLDQLLAAALGGNSSHPPKMGSLVTSAFLRPLP